MIDRKTYSIDEFLDEIKDRARKDDRGYLAKLRRGLSPATEAQAWPIIARQKFDFTNQVKRRVWTMVGAWAALLISDGCYTDSYTSLGSVLRKLLGEHPSDGQQRSYDAKLRRLMDSSDIGELCDLVSEIVRMASQKRVEVNCRMLFWEIYNWDNIEKREGVRIRWTRDFYSIFDKKEDDNG